MAVDALELRPPINLKRFEQPGLGASNGRAYRTTFGEEGWEYFKLCARGGDVRDVDKVMINNEFVARFGMCNGLPANTPQGAFHDHWTAQVEAATNAVSSVIRKIAPHREELLQPLSNPLYDPSEVIRLLATPTARSEDTFKGVSRDLKHTAATVLMLASFAGEIAVSMPPNRFNVKAGEVTRHFEKTLFEGKNEGDTKTLTLYSDHHLETNGLARHGLDLGELPIGHRRFQHVVKARTTRSGDEFFYDGGIKKPESSALKVLRYELDRSGEVPEGADLTRNLRDYIRFRFVSFDRSNLALRRLRKDVIDALQQFPGGFYDLNITASTKQNLGSAAVDMERVYLRMPHFEGRIAEFMFLTHAEMVDQYRHTGNEDPQTGIKDGKGHELYDIRRNAELAKKVLFPEPVLGYSLDGDIKEASDLATKRLETEGLIAENKGFGLT